MMTDKPKGVFLYHTACQNPKCGSSDAMGIYSDGTAWCFSCETYFPNAEGEGKKAKKIDKSLVFGDYRSLTSRRITIETCRKFGYQVGEHKGEAVQIANYYDREGTLVAQKLRTQDKTFRWTGDAGKATLFGQQAWRNEGKRIVITEGEIDAMSISQAFGNKWQVVSVPNGAGSARKAIKAQLDWLENFDTVVLAFDGDEQGQNAVQECAPLFTPGKCKVMSYPNGYKDANEMLVKGDPAGIATAVFEAKTFRPDGIVAGVELWDTLKEYMEGGPQRLSYDSPYPELNYMLQNFRKRELVTFTAGTGIGKTTAVGEIAYHMMMKHNLSLGYVALEESKERTALRMMSVYLNKPLHLSLDGVTDEEYARAFNATIGNGRFFLYDHFGSLDSDNLLNKVKYLATGCDVDFIVLDHITIAISGIADGDERRMIDNLMTNLRSIVEETGVGIFVISHLRRKPDGQAAEEGARISLSDLRGSGAIAQLSDTVIAMERDQQDKENGHISQLRVLKSRHTGRTGVADTLEYNLETGRLEIYVEPAPEEDNPDFS